MIMFFLMRCGSNDTVMQIILLMFYSYCCLILLVAWLLNRCGVSSHFVYLFYADCDLLSLLLTSTKCN